MAYKPCLWRKGHESVTGGLQLGTSGTAFEANDREMLVFRGQ